MGKLEQWVAARKKIAAILEQQHKALIKQKQQIFEKWNFTIKEFQQQNRTWFTTWHQIYNQGNQMAEAPVLGKKQILSRRNFLQLLNNLIQNLTTSLMTIDQQSASVNTLDPVTNSIVDIIKNQQAFIEFQQTCETKQLRLNQFQQLQQALTNLMVMINFNAIAFKNWTLKNDFFQKNYAEKKYQPGAASNNSIEDDIIELQKLANLYETRNWQWSNQQRANQDKTTAKIEVDQQSKELNLALTHEQQKSKKLSGNQTIATYQHDKLDIPANLKTKIAKNKKPLSKSETEWLQTLNEKKFKLLKITQSLHQAIHNIKLASMYQTKINGKHQSATMENLLILLTNAKTMITKLEPFINSLQEQNNSAMPKPEHDFASARFPTNHSLDLLKGENVQLSYLVQQSNTLQNESEGFTELFSNPSYLPSSQLTDNIKTVNSLNSILSVEKDALTRILKKQINRLSKSSNKKTLSSIDEIDETIDNNDENHNFPTEKFNELMELALKNPDLASSSNIVKNPKQNDDLISLAEVEADNQSFTASQPTLNLDELILKQNATKDDEFIE